MAKNDAKPSRVRYRVTGPVFVNGSYLEPGREATYVWAAAGLAGGNLELAPGGEEPTRAPAQVAGGLPIPADDGRP